MQRRVKAGPSHYKQDSFRSHAHLGSAKATALSYTGRGNELQIEGLQGCYPSPSPQLFFFFETMPADPNPENRVICSADA